MTPPKPKKTISPKVKALAVDKQAATRKARGITGKKQRKAITVTSATAPAATPATAATATTTPKP